MDSVLERIATALETIANGMGTIGWGNTASPANDQNNNIGTDSYGVLVAADDMTELRKLCRERGLTYGPKSKAETLADNLRKWDAENPNGVQAPPDPFGTSTASATPVITQQDIVDVLQKVVAEISLDKVYELLKLGGVDQVAALAEEHYAQVHAEAKKALAAAGK